MEGVNENTNSGEHVAGNFESAVPSSKPEKSEAVKTDKDTRQSLRNSIEKNFEKSGHSNGKPTDGDSTTPAANKSFVNGENQQQAAPPQETILPPKGMNEEEKKTWDSLTPEGKKFLARRGYETESTFNRRMAELTAKEREFSDIGSAVTPEVREEYTRQGIAIPDLIRRSIAWDKRVKEGVDGALEFLEAHGYSAEQLAGYRSQPAEQPQPLTQEDVNRLVEEKFQLQQQSRIAEESAKALTSFLDSKPVFRSDPGTVAQVEHAVAKQIEFLFEKENFQGSTAQVLEEAFRRAVAINPAFSGLAPSPQTAAAKDPKPEDIHQQMERVRAAKAASKSASGSLGSGSPQHKSNTLRESLERNFAKS